MVPDKGPLKTTSDSDKLALRSLPRVSGNWKTIANLKVRTVNGNVRFTIYLNPQEGERVPSSISLNFDPVAIESFLLQVEEVASGKIEGTGMEYRDFERKGKERGDKILPVGAVRVVKTPEGTFQLLVAHKEIQADGLVFPLTSSDFWVMLDPQGNPVTPAAASRIFTRGWASFVAKMLAITVNETHSQWRLDRAAKDGKDKKTSCFGSYLLALGSNRGSGGGGDSSSYSKPKGSYNDSAPKTDSGYGGYQKPQNEYNGNNVYQ